MTSDLRLTASRTKGEILRNVPWAQLNRFLGQSGSGAKALKAGWEEGDSHPLATPAPWYSESAALTAGPRGEDSKLHPGTRPPSSTTVVEENSTKTQTKEIAALRVAAAKAAYRFRVQCPAVNITNGEVLWPRDTCRHRGDGLCEPVFLPRRWLAKRPAPHCQSRSPEVLEATGLRASAFRQRRNPSADLRPASLWCLIQPPVTLGCPL